MVVQQLGALLDLHPQEIGSTVEETSARRGPALQEDTLEGEWRGGQALLKARHA